jgi:hypothetical protein
MNDNLIAFAVTNSVAILSSSDESKLMTLRCFSCGVAKNS